MHADDDYPISPLRNAFTSLTGALLSSSIACMLPSGFITIVASWSDYMWKDLLSANFFDVIESIVLTFCLSWLGQWVVSGIALYGILLIAIHCYLINELIQGDRDPWFVLAAIFTNHTIVSTSTLLFLIDGSQNIFPVITAGIICLSLGIYFLFQLRCN